MIWRGLLHWGAPRGEANRESTCEIEEFVKTRDKHRIGITSMYSL